MRFPIRVLAPLMTTEAPPAPAVPPAPPVTPPAEPPVAAVPPATPPAAVPPQDPAAPPAPPATAPETYALTLPENGVLEQADLDAIAVVAKEKGLTNEQAQDAVTSLNADLQRQAQTFKARLDTHPEIGGTKFPVAQEDANRVLDRFLPTSQAEGAEFRAAMNKSGYGNYAPLMLLLSRIGKAMREDTPLGATTTTTATAAERVSDAAAMYPTTTPV